MADRATFTGVYLYVRDLRASAAFYERLGFVATVPGDDFLQLDAGNGTSIELGTAEVTRRYDPAWREAAGPATNTLNFLLASRDAVDAMYAELVAAGYGAHLAPIDAFWGARYAMIDDPDGNHVGLQSPRA